MALWTSQGPGGRNSGLRGGLERLGFECWLLPKTAIDQGPPGGIWGALLTFSLIAQKTRLSLPPLAARVHRCESPARATLLALRIGMLLERAAEAREGGGTPPAKS